MRLGMILVLSSTDEESLVARIFYRAMNAFLFPLMALGLYVLAAGYVIS